jgi:hypothetical protein
MFVVDAENFGTSDKANVVAKAVTRATGEFEIAVTQRKGVVRVVTPNAKAAALACSTIVAHMHFGIESRVHAFRIENDPHVDHSA